MALRPLTWAKPVSPGRTHSRRACRGLYSGTYFTYSGRGPHRAQLPLTTFHSDGSSSKEVLRRNRPNPSSRCSSGSRAPAASRRSDMVRNLYRVKLRPSFPARSWRNSTGAPRCSRTARATRPRTGLSTARASRASTVSWGSLIYFS